MNALKDALVSWLVLALPNCTGQMTLYTDAGDKQVGCILLQKQEDKTVRLFGYCSCSLNNAEKKHETTQREFLSIASSVLILQPYLEGKRFTILANHDSCKWILNLPDSTGRLAQWRVRLWEYDFDVLHRAGIRHQANDAKSRLQTTGEHKTHLDEDLPLLAIDEEEKKAS